MQVPHLDIANAKADCSLEMDSLEEKFGPLVSTEPCALLDTSYVLKGKYVTLENLRREHIPDLWENWDFRGAGASIEDFLPGDRAENMEKVIEDLEGIVASGVTTYVVKGNLAKLNPGSNSSSSGEQHHDRVLGVIFVDTNDFANRAAETGMIYSKALHRTAASTEAHYLWLKNICEPNSPGLKGGKSPPYRRVAWRCNSLNIYSKRCAERIGYKLEGTMRKNMIAKGRSRDTDMYAFVEEEWPAIRDALELWLAESNFDDGGRQRKRLEDIRKSLAK